MRSTYNQTPQIELANRGKCVVTIKLVTAIDNRYAQTCEEEDIAVADRLCGAEVRGYVVDNDLPLNGLANHSLKHGQLHNVR